MASKLNLDKLDLQIIHEMMETAEISYAELGKKLFVSGGTIHVRIKKLQEFGIVKGTKLNVDLRQLGYDITAFVGDRKSTRLNSSHSQISYAVFCLKKKN